MAQPILNQGILGDDLPEVGGGKVLHFGEIRVEFHVFSAESGR